MYVPRYSHETPDQAFDRAIRQIGITKNQSAMKANECERLKAERKEQNEVIRKMNATIKSLQSENKALKDQKDENVINDLPIREKLAASKAKNIVHENTIRELKDDKKKLKSSNSAKDNVINFLETENKRLKCQLEKVAPSTPNSHGTIIMKPKVGQTVEVVDEKNADKKKPRKRKASDVADPTTVTSVFYSEATSNTVASNDSDISLTLEEASKSQRCFTFQAQFNF